MGFPTVLASSREIWGLRDTQGYPCHHFCGGQMLITSWTLLLGGWMAACIVVCARWGLMCSLKRVHSQLTNTEVFKMNCQGGGEGDVCRAGLDCGSSFVAFQTACFVWLGNKKCWRLSSRLPNILSWECRRGEGERMEKGRCEGGSCSKMEKYTRT